MCGPGFVCEAKPCNGYRCYSEAKCVPIAGKLIIYYSLVIIMLSIFNDLMRCFIDK